MPVLIERVALVASAEALRRATGEADGGAAALGAEAVASDGELTALHFSGPPELEAAAERLAAAGLVAWREDDEPGGLAVVGQRLGPVAWWPWLELAVVPTTGGGPALAARRAGSEAVEVAVPAGWRWEGSASAGRGARPLEPKDRPLRHLRREPAGDVYRDRWTGEEVRLARQHAPVRVVVAGPGAARGEVVAELVTSLAEVELGLMFREALPAGAGMLFRFHEVGRHGFWMKNTLVSLDLLFVDDEGWVVNVAEAVPPLTATHRWSARPVRSVLEVAAGWCAAHGVGAGARVAVEPAPPVGGGLAGG